MKEGTYEYLRLIHVDVQQKPIQHCKAIILQLKRKKKTRMCLHFLICQMGTLTLHSLVHMGRL